MRRARLTFCERARYAVQVARAFVHIFGWRDMARHPGYLWVGFYLAGVFARHAERERRRR